MIERAFIFGAGYSGRAFGRLVSGRFPVSGTTRSDARFAGIEAAGIEPLLFDGATLSEAVRAALAETMHLIVSAAPDEAGDPVLNAVGGVIRNEMPRLRWIGYLSTARGWTRRAPVGQNRGDRWTA